MFNIAQSAIQIQSRLAPCAGRSPGVQAIQPGELAERATGEQDPEILMITIEEITGVLSQRL